MDAIEVVRPASLPVGAIVLADSDFLTHLADVELQAGMLEVTDVQAEQDAANMLNELTKAAKAIEQKRIELTAPFLAMQRQIKEAADKAQTRISTIKETISRKSIDFRTAEEAKARKAEAERQAAIARQEAERRRIEEEARRKAEEDRKANEAREAAGKPIELSFEAAPPPPAPVVVPPPVRAAPKPVGSRYVTYLMFDVKDAKQLPPQFQLVTPNHGAIRSVFVTGWREGAPLPTCQGVTFWTEKRMQGSGR